jgi:branched-chain amino acid transport system permease protein
MEWFDNFWAVYSNLVLSLGTNALLALSVYVTLSCGMLTLANAAFMGIGAYTSAIMTTTYGVPYYAALPCGVLAPCVVAWLIGKPTLRLSGVYLCMATLGFGEVARIFFLNSVKLTGGLIDTGEAMGLNGIEQSTQWWHVLLAVALALFVLGRVRRSRLGRAFNAIKEDETAASLMGVNVAATKMLAFVMGAALAGLAGALNAHLTYFIGPNEYGFDRAVEILTMAVLGGIHSAVGPVLGSAILTTLPELLRALADYRLMVNGFVLVLIVLFLPRGIWDPAGFKRLLLRGSGKGK